MFGFSKILQELKKVIEELIILMEKNVNKSFDKYRLLNIKTNTYKCEREVELILDLVQEGYAEVISIDTAGVFPDGTPKYIIFYQKIKNIGD